MKISGFIGWAVVGILCSVALSYKLQGYNIAKLMQSSKKKIIEKEANTINIIYNNSSEIRRYFVTSTNKDKNFIPFCLVQLKNEKYYLVQNCTDLNIGAILSKNKKIILLQSIKEKTSYLDYLVEAKHPEKKIGVYVSMIVVTQLSALCSEEFENVCEIISNDKEFLIKKP